MSFWSALAKIGGFAAAPFTAGMSIPIGQAIGGGLDAAGKISQGMGAGRQADADANFRQDALRRQASLDAMQAQLANRQLPGQRAQGAVRGDILQNVQPFALTGSGRDLKGTGGISPALLSEGTRQLGGQMSREALLSALGQGGANDPYAAIKPSFTGPTPLPKAGKLEKILGGLGLFGGIGQSIAGPQSPEDDSWMLGPHR